MQKSLIETLYLWYSSLFTYHSSIGIRRKMRGYPVGTKYWSHNVKYTSSYKSSHLFLKYLSWSITVGKVDTLTWYHQIVCYWTKVRRSPIHHTPWMHAKRYAIWLDRLDLMTDWVTRFRQQLTKEKYIWVRKASCVSGF